MLLRFLARCVRRRLGSTLGRLQRRAVRRSLGSLSLLATLACQGSPNQDPLGWDQLQQAVIGGVLDDESRHPGVVGLLAKTRQEVSFCSGTLIAPNLVLTALHCVSPLNELNFSCALDGTLIQHRPGAGELGPLIDPEDVAIYAGVVPDLDKPVAKGQALFSTGSTQICRNDIALLVLDRDLDLALTPLRLDEPTVAGETVTVVGYGHSGDPVVNRHLRSGVRIIDVGSDDQGGDGGFAPSRTFATGRSTCPGDSGGPALAERTPGAPIAGIYSIVAGDCTADSARNIFTQVAPFRELILEAFEHVGHEPWKPEPAAPVDAGEPDPANDTSTDESSGLGSETSERSGSSDESTEGPSTDEITSPERQRRLRSGCGIGATAGSSSPSALWLMLLLGARRARHEKRPAHPRWRRARSSR